MKPVAIAAFLLSMVPVAKPQTAQQPDKQSPQRRLALIIGNQNYVKLPAVTAAPKEAVLIRTALEKAGFKVTQADNTKLNDLAQAAQGFTDQVQRGDICVFYFSGHALQNEDNDFLLPIDFDPSVSGNLRNRAYPITHLALNLQEKGAGLKMLFLEGARRIDASVPDASLDGLLIPDTGAMTEVLFGIPTAANQYVEAPLDQVGLFTSALAETIDREGVPITQLMGDVLKTVSDKSKNQQQPANGTKLTQEFYFHKPKPQRPQPHQNHTDREFYAWIPPGQFLMGCVPPGTQCDKEEKPQHQVTISKAFWIGQNEVRVVSYKKFVQADPKNRKMPKDYFENQKWRLDDHPINNVKWEEAGAYCSWAGGRLPTEAEWEYAARGGKDNEVYPFDPTDPEKSRDKANFDGKHGNDIFEYTAPVRSFDANGFGLYDMSGNVWELVSDFFDLYPGSAAVDPQGPKDGKQHVQRGGSYDSDPKKHLRISYRERFAKPWTNVGFRCVMDDTPATQKLLQNP